MEEDFEEQEKGGDVDPVTKKVGLVYVKRWISLEDAVMFRMSNRVIQVRVGFILIVSSILWMPQES